MTGAQKGATCPQGQLGMSCQVRKAVTCRLRKRLIPHVVAREYNVAVLASDRVRFARMITNWAPRPPSGYSFVWVVCAEILACVKSASSTTATDRKPIHPPKVLPERAGAAGPGRVPLSVHARRRETGGATKALRLNFDSRSRTHRTLPRGRLRDTAPPRKSLCDKIIESWAAPERHRSARLAPVTGTPLPRRARPARGAERTIDPSGGHSPAVQRARLMWY